MSEVKELSTTAHQMSQWMYNVNTDYITDLNDAVTPGLWLLDGNSTPKNAPTVGNYVCGIVEVFARYGNIIQRITSFASAAPYMAIRMRWNGKWTEWKVI